MTEETHVMPPGKTSRCCANCACYIAMSPVDGVCTLATPEYTKVRQPIPRLNREGKPDIGKDGRPVMIMGEAPAYRYPQTMGSMWCYAGWRPQGVKPGESGNEVRVRKFAAAFGPVIDSVLRGEHDSASRERAIRDALRVLIEDDEPAEAANDQAAPSVIQ
jgi:hypothetical protein